MSEIEKFKLEETLRRLYFKHRGNVIAVAREAGLEKNLEYVRRVTDKIKKGFNHTVNFEIACFVTDALLAGREQRLIIMEDRVKDLLKQMEWHSTCCSARVTKNEYEEKTWYKCNKCLQDCDVTLDDCIKDMDVVRYLDRMRKEDELIYKFMVTMGFISKMDDKEQPGVLPANVIESQSKALSEEDAEMLKKLQGMNGTDISQIRKMVEEKIEEATQDNSDAK
jgi:hypothetical protein